MGNFKSLIDQINTNNAFEVDTIQRFKQSELTSLQEQEVSKFILDKGIELPNSYIKNTLQSPALSYTYSSDDVIVGGGEFCLSSLSDIILDTYDCDLGDEFMDEETLDIVSKFRLIDDHPISGYSKLAALVFDEKKQIGILTFTTMTVDIFLR